jgi:hypothetical protein
MKLLIVREIDGMTRSLREGIICRHENDRRLLLIRYHLTENKKRLLHLGVGMANSIIPHSNDWFNTRSPDWMHPLSIQLFTITITTP